MIRPQVHITGYVNQELKRYKMSYVYSEYPNIPKIIDHISFPSLDALNKAIETCVKHAKRHTYDYRITLVSPGVKQK